MTRRAYNYLCSMKNAYEIELLPRDLYPEEIDEILWKYGIVFKEAELIRVQGTSVLEELDLNQIDLFKVKQEIKDNYKVIGYCTVANCWCSSVQLKQIGKNSFADIFKKYDLISEKKYSSLSKQKEEIIFLEIGV